MDRIAAPSISPDAPIRPRADQADKVVEQQHAEPSAAPHNDNMPSDLEITLDRGAQRFVQVFTDPDTAELVLRYPSEAQLAYSRAVVAYMKALSESWRDDS
jgi:hypothetical protein